MAQIQLQAGRISVGLALSHSAAHNLLVILLWGSDSDVTVFQAGSWRVWPGYLTQNENINMNPDAGQRQDAVNTNPSA